MVHVARERDQDGMGAAQAVQVQQALGELNARLQAQEAELQTLRATAAATAAGGGSAGSGARPGRTALTIDTRQLNRPEQFKGDPPAWREWKTIFTSYAGVASSKMSAIGQITGAARRQN